MKRIYCVLIILGALAIAVAAVSLLGITDVYAMEEFEEATVMNDGVNLRLCPDTEAPVVTELSKGTRIGVFCEETEGWLRVIYGNYRGYVSREFVFIPSQDDMSCYAAGDGVTVKRSPGAFSATVAAVNAGDGMVITDVCGEWYGVQTSDGATGYVLRADVEESSGATAGTQLRKGMSGAEVTKLQQALSSKGFMGDSVTGYYGDITALGVRVFQRKAGLSADGIAGEQTLSVLYDPACDLTCTAAERAGIENKVTMPSWDDIKNGRLKKGTVFKITDVRTGLSFNAQRFGGWYHADSEPCTAEDTATMKKIAGGKWSWNRRPIWVTIGDRTYAASMHCMPHMANPTASNNFPGHFCVHFLHSKVHENSKECPRHQACVQDAYWEGTH